MWTYKKFAYQKVHESQSRNLDKLMSHFKSELQNHQPNLYKHDNIKELQKKTDSFFKEKVFEMKENLNMINKNEFLVKSGPFRPNSPSSKFDKK